MSKFDRETLNEIGQIALKTYADDVMIQFFLPRIWCGLALILITLLGSGFSAWAGPEDVLKEYSRAVFARDFQKAYAFISRADREWKTEAEYLRENGVFQGFTLEVAQKLASFIQYRHFRIETEDGRAKVKVDVRLPNANASPILELVLDWDEERLNSLSDPQKEAILERLDDMQRKGDLPMLSGEESFELIKEETSWRVFLDWAGAVRVYFSAAVKEGLPWEFYPVQPAVLAKPGETLQMWYKAKNLSPRAITAKARHIDEPRELAEKYLQIIQCFCFIQETLDPGEEKEFLVVFRVHWDVPEEVKSFRVVYEFYPLASFKPEGEER